MNWDWRAPAVFFLQPFRNRTFADREGSEVSKHWPKLEALIPASDKHPLASSFLYPLPETFRFMKGRCSLYASSTLAPQKEKRASEVGNNFRRVCHRLDICNNSSYQTDGRRWTISLCHTHTHTHSPAEPVDQYRPYVISKDVHARMDNSSIPPTSPQQLERLRQLLYVEFTRGWHTLYQRWQAIDNSNKCHFLYPFRPTSACYICAVVPRKTRYPNTGLLGLPESKQWQDCTKSCTYKDVFMTFITPSV